MKYIAKPIVVEAHQIVQLLEAHPLGCTLRLDNGQDVKPSADMLARIEPKPGDYWVEQEDGYTYLNPKDVFERKYAPAVNRA